VQAPSIRTPFHSRTGRCRQEFSDEQVDQSSRDSKLGARRNHKFLSHFRFIGQDGSPLPHALARVPNPRRWQIVIWKQWPQGHKVEAELAGDRIRATRDHFGPRSLRFKCNGFTAFKSWTT
jgi:hypothetical protein